MNDLISISASNAEELLAVSADKPTHVNRCKADISSEVLPTKEWQNEQIANFSNARLKIARHFALQKQNSSQEQEKIKLPATRNEYGN